MIQEDFVSFETAKLLKEKEFDETCRSFWKVWDKHTTLCDCSPSHMFEYCHNSMLEKYNDEEELNIAAPTLQMAMKWLREKHNIAISVYVFNRDLPIKEGEISYTCDIATPFISSKEGHLRLVGSYEKACEEAIKYCLENLI